MYRRRNNEKQFQYVNKPQRTTRGFEINGQWYFELRGGGQKGPYDNELKMQADLNDFIKCHNQMNKKTQFTP